VTSPLVHIERDQQFGVVVAHLREDIDSSNVADVMLPLADQADGQTLVLDLTDVQYLDSAGMAAIETLRTRTKLYIVAPRASVVRRALEIGGVQHLVPLLERLEEVPQKTERGFI
jgi:anti-anti-sigma factor